MNVQSSEPTECKKEFIDGPPPGVCREYTSEELGAILRHYLPDQVVETAQAIDPSQQNTGPSSAETEQPSIDQNKEAIFVSGLPACGKSTMARQLLQLPDGDRCKYIDLINSPSDLIHVDCDELRMFHQEYAALIRRPIVHRDLVSWFMQTSNFVHSIFKNTEVGLVPRLLDRGKPFVLHAVMDSEANLKFMKHVQSRGYRIHLIHIHVAAETAVARAERRARSTGRWTPRSFISSKTTGLSAMLEPLAHVALSSAGSVLVLDNSQECDGSVRALPLKLVHRAPCPARFNDLLPRLQAGLSEELGHDKLRRLSVGFLSPDLLRTALATCAERLVTALFDRLPGPSTSQQELDKISFCLVGGCFRSCLALGSRPNDLDIWPCDEHSQKVLRDILSRPIEGVCSEKSSKYNTQFRYNQHPGSHSSFRTDLVELVTKICSSPQAVLSRCDIALSAAGAQVEARFQQMTKKWTLKVVNTTHDDLWPRSLQEHRVHLIQPLRNKRYVLATAERCCRYAAEHGFAVPEAELSILLESFQAQAHERPEEFPDGLIARYASTTRSDQHALVVCEHFSIDSARVVRQHTSSSP